jgi:molybdopterin converting factor small subunit
MIGRMAFFVQKDTSYMNIELKLFFDFKNYLPSGSSKNTTTIDLESGTTVQKLIEILNLPPAIPKNIIVNGITADNERELQDGDSVAVFPPMAGG